MIKRLLFCFSGAFMLTSAVAQKKDFSYKFYGFVRGDMSINSRNSAESFEGQFHLYPLPKTEDANGEDMNENSSSNLSVFASRVGVDIAGPKIGNAKTTARLESDFAATNPNNFLLRVRHIYLNLAWENGSSVLMGQTWHPLFGEVMPEVLNLSTGCPFQPFSRAPQIRYQYKTQGFTFTASALYQQMYLSYGPNGRSSEYQRYGVVPELFAGVNYAKNGFLVGAGVERLSIKPRLRSVVNNNTYKVDERVSSFSYVAQTQYKTEKLFLAGKTILGSNLSHLSIPGGYAVSSVDPITGEQEYTPSRHSVSWVEAVYGTKWRGGLMLGYSKNIGMNKPIEGAFYGTGFDIDQLSAGVAHISYNLPHWKIGVEYTGTRVWYGNTNIETGKVENAEGITGHRLTGVFMYYF